MGEPRSGLDEPKGWGRVLFFFFLIHKKINEQQKNSKKSKKFQNSEIFKKIIEVINFLIITCNTNDYSLGGMGYIFIRVRFDFPLAYISFSDSSFLGLFGGAL
jgi:hypothetical protein